MVRPNSHEFGYGAPCGLGGTAAFGGTAFPGRTTTQRTAREGHPTQVGLAPATSTVLKLARQRQDFALDPGQGFLRRGTVQVVDVPVLDAIGPGREALL